MIFDIYIDYGVFCNLKMRSLLQENALWKIKSMRGNIYQSNATNKIRHGRDTPRKSAVIYAQMNLDAMHLPGLKMIQTGRWVKIDAA